MTETYDKLNHWYGWNGGECPVHPETRVQTSGAWGLGTEHPAHCIDWHNGGLAAFRIIKLHVEPREFWLSHGRVFKSYRDAVEVFPACSITHVREVEQPL